MDKYYACILINSNEKIIFKSWEECKATIKGKNNKIKSFKTIEQAQNWLFNNGDKIYQSPIGIYFDSGTGRGKGVEIRVVNEKRISILDKILDKSLINEYGNHYVKNFQGISNNFGELLALYTALKIALKENITNIFGDSKLIIEYWSKGIYNSKKLKQITINLIKKTTELRKKFEEQGGKISFIPGDENIADLGFHKTK
ncbi:ribonuclease H family protein [Borreliella tanukii]|uniref:ribonuclease H family protein n=1 Tax=Borreliella tanukii TaxID=56146 RepID=UPI002647039C|nr:ribonuclease H family protein [Borreliella tanukii]WKC82944.1 ribonuclease H family protein [Borreliella tanukii]